MEVQAAAGLSWQGWERRGKQVPGQQLEGAQVLGAKLIHPGSCDPWGLAVTPATAQDSSALQQPEGGSEDLGVPLLQPP